MSFWLGVIHDDRCFEASCFLAASQSDCEIRLTALAASPDVPEDGRADFQAIDLDGSTPFQHAEPRWSPYAGQNAKSHGGSRKGRFVSCRYVW